MKLTEKLLTLSARLTLAKDRTEILQLARELNELSFDAIEKEQDTENGNFTSGHLEFTNQEVLRMPKTFRKEFRAEGCTAHVRKRLSGKKSYNYEIRYRRNGYNISVSSKNLEAAKEKFIRAIHVAEQEKNEPAQPTIPNTFNAFANYYFETFRAKKVASKTLKNDLNRYKNYLYPYFEETPIAKITPKECQTLIDQITAKGYGKTTDEVYSLMSVIFKSAILHGLIQHNPLNTVIHEDHERQHGTSLSKKDENTLLSAYKGTEYEVPFAVILYTGLRPNEYQTAKIKGDFIISVNSKRKTKKTEHKKIPISPMLRPYLDNLTEIHFPNYKKMWERFTAVLPEHILYDLRTTFYTRCKECGIAKPALDEFMGHSSGKLSDAYTDLSDEYLLREGNKLNY